MRRCGGLGRGGRPVAAGPRPARIYPSLARRTASIAHLSALAAGRAPAIEIVVPPAGAVGPVRGAARYPAANPAVRGTDMKATHRRATLLKCLSHVSPLSSGAAPSILSNVLIGRRAMARCG